jgi:hypothetical protein
VNAAELTFFDRLLGAAGVRAYRIGDHRTAYRVAAARHSFTRHDAGAADLFAASLRHVQVEAVRTAGG